MFGWNGHKDKVEDVNMLAVTSFDPDLWSEIAEEESARGGLMRTLDPNDAEKNATILRKLFPLKARLLKNNMTINLQEGVILKYARVRRTPSRYPIEVFFTTKNAAGAVSTRKMMVDSSEVELLEP